MSEYRHTETGEVKTQGQWRSHYSNVSLPRVWKAATLAGLNLETVLASPAATTTQYQSSLRDGVVQDADGNWVENYVAQDMFADTTDEDGVTTTKAQHEAAYQAALDANTATANRKTRNDLLDTSDWTQMNDSPLTNELKTAWATYRQELRGLTDVDAWPNLTEDDWPVAP